MHTSCWRMFLKRSHLTVRGYGRITLKWIFVEQVSGIGGNTIGIRWCPTAGFRYRLPFAQFAYLFSSLKRGQSHKQTNKQTKIGVQSVSRLEGNLSLLGFSLAIPRRSHVICPLHSGTYRRAHGMRDSSAFNAT